MIAQTILQQLGGNKFIAMTGSHTFVKHENWLRMTLRRNVVGAKWLKITLNCNDLYDLEFLSERKGVVSTKRLVEGVYFDQLQEVFTSVTGLYTKL
jgi:hypothetical protein